MSYLIRLAVLISALAPISLLAQDTAQPERFTATAFAIRGPAGGRSTLLDFRITHWTTDAEMQEYGNILREQGQDALRRKLEDVRIGNVSPSGRLGTDIAIARRIDAGDGKTRIRVATVRRMPFFELYYSGRSTNYPFGIFEFEIDENGKGKEGAVIVAAKVQFTDSGQFEIVTYGLETIRLGNIRAIKPKKKK